MRALILILLFSTQTSFAADEKALWEYGAGFGYVHYEHYPAANQFSSLSLPFPTFQYRGEILRADDRDGARTYLYKKDAWSLQISGGGYAPLDSKTNRARQGMENLPFMIQLGPQLVYSPAEQNWQAKLGLFQANAIEGDFIKKNGAMLDAQFVYHLDYGHSQGRLSLGTKIASQELQATYFEVSGKDVTSERAAYEAKGGFLETEMRYFHSYTSGKLSLYSGVGLSSYSNSVNRASPLHKSDLNFTYLVGLTYVLGESARRSVPPEQTEGLINHYQSHRKTKPLPFE